MPRFLSRPGKLPARRRHHQVARWVHGLRDRLGSRASALPSAFASGPRPFILPGTWCQTHGPHGGGRQGSGAGDAR